MCNHSRSQHSPAGVTVVSAGNGSERVTGVKNNDLSPFYTGSVHRINTRRQQHDRYSPYWHDFVKNNGWAIPLFLQNAERKWTLKLLQQKFGSLYSGMQMNVSTYLLFRTLFFKITLESLPCTPIETHCLNRSSQNINFHVR